MLTASRMPDVMDILKNGKPGAKRVKLLKELVLQRYAGIVSDNYVTPAMLWGLDHQEEAINEYEIETGNIVGAEAFVIHPTIHELGATPDGFIGHDRLLEVKCPQSNTFLDWIIDIRDGKSVPECHKPQMAVQLLCTGRRIVDFMAYDPRMPPKKRRFIAQFEPPREYLEMIENEAKKFLLEVEQLFEEVTTA